MSTRIGIDNPVTLQQILNQMKAYQAELRQIKQEKAAIAEAHIYDNARGKIDRDTFHNAVGN
ncbi:hypothetical protein E4U38_003467 [Claviceps purpurea]|nr:hypothetical protein E4U38_003467 [Claviceps purpurea]KAG6151797.1 hypothetical protein E4U37_004531 [Claviceps purpurea]KAG6236961.1 hypothetical protein E4U23_000145 [Claviceps purpurea]